MSIDTHPGTMTLSLSGAARILGVHPNTMRTWADQGRIRCLRVNARGDRRFRSADLAAFLAEAETRAAPTRPQGGRGARPADDGIESSSSSDTSVTRLAVELAAATEASAIAARLVEGARTLFAADRAAVLRSTTDGRLRTETAHGLSRAHLARLPILATALATAFGREQPLVLRARAGEASDAGPDAGPGGLAGLLRAEGIAVAALCPLRAEGAAEGLLVVYHDDRYTWTRQRLDDLGAVGLGAAVAMRNARTVGRMEARAAQLQSIQQLGTRLNRLSAVADIGRAICAELRQLIDYHNVRVYRVLDDDVVPVAWRGETGEYVDEHGDELRLKVGDGITGWVALHGTAVCLPDAAADPRAWTIPGTDELDESMLLAPMLFDDRVIGVIVLSKLGLDQFGDDDLRYLTIYASIAAQAMVNADATERLREQSSVVERRLESQRQLLSITESILADLDPVAVVAGIADRLGGLIPVDDMGIAVREGEAGHLRPLLARGTHAQRFMSHDLPGNAGLVGWVVEHGEARLLQGDRGRPPIDPLSDPEPGSGALIVAPLRARERTMGVLTLERTGMDASFSDDEFELIRLFAGHVSIALQNAFAHQAVERRARTDALTGLHNQGSFQEDLGRAVDFRRPFGLLIIDLDDFKSYNDRHGHEAGNALLRAIALAMRGACRDVDGVYRYGGDEFAILLPGSRTSGALGVAHRVRRAIRGLDDPRNRARAGVRCSVGLATYPDDATDAAGLLLAADRACYAAKHAGGDSVATAAQGQALVVGSAPARTPVDAPVPD